MSEADVFSHLSSIGPPVDAEPGSGREQDIQAEVNGYLISNATSFIPLTSNGRIDGVT